MTEARPTYLGDGVYASFDGYQIWLGLHEGQHLIALEPQTMQHLREYEKRISDYIKDVVNKKQE